MSTPYFSNIRQLIVFRYVSEIDVADEKLKNHPSAKWALDAYINEPGDYQR